MSPQVQSSDLLQIECDYETSKMGVLISFGGIIMLFVTFLASFSAMVAKELGQHLVMILCLTICPKSLII